MNTITRALAIAAIAVTTLGASAQDRQYIREQIAGWGQCRNVAITNTNGDMAIYGGNGNARSSCPEAFNEKIIQINNDKLRIEDVCLTENGNWIILYDKNSFWWSGIPSGLESKVRQFNADGDDVTSVTFNDRGEWILVSTTHIAAYPSDVQDWLFEGCNEYGALWSAHMTDDGIVAVYESGYQYRGNVPAELKTKLRETDIDVYRAKFAGTSWFFADKDGNYQYSM